MARLHLNPAKHAGRVFVEFAANLSDARLRLLALAALFYAGMRWIEAYGLRHARRWAEWVAVVSGGVYLPLEMAELSRGFSWLKISMLTLNLAVVLYLVWILVRQSAARSTE